MSFEINRFLINVEVFNKIIIEDEVKIFFKGENVGKIYFEVVLVLVKVYEFMIFSEGIFFDDVRVFKIVNFFQYYFKVIFVDVNGLFYQVWMVLVNVYKEGKIIQEQFEKFKDEFIVLIEFKDFEIGQMVIFIEEYVVKINDRIVIDVGFQSQFMDEWCSVV